MSIDSKTIERSMKFYRNYDSERRLQDYALTLAFKNESFISIEDAIERFKDDYSKYMKKHFDFSILFADEIMQFAFDEHGNVKALDEIIYQKLRLYASKCRVLAYEEKIRLMDQAGHRDRFRVSLGEENS